MKAIDRAFAQWRWRAAATVNYNFPCSEHMSCIGNYVAQLRGYLILLVYGLQMTIWSPKVPTNCRPIVLFCANLKVLY
jgi:hypothetical protein